MDKVMARKFWMVLLGLALPLTLAACPAQKSIAEIQHDPARYANQELLVRGTVVQSIGVLGTGMFELDDGTGRIWIYSEHYGVPSKGVRVGVTGTIVPVFAFGGRNFVTVMRETERRQY